MVVVVYKILFPRQARFLGDEKQRRLLFWGAVMSLTVAATVALGTAMLTVGVQRRSAGYTPLAQGATSEVTAKALRLQTAAVFIVYYSIVLGVVTWSVQSSRISGRTGLDWELYFVLLLCGCLWLLIQARSRDSIHHHHHHLCIAQLTNQCIHGDIMT